MIKSERRIVEICHAALRAYSESHMVLNDIGEYPNSALSQVVRHVLNNPATTPRGMYEKWLYGHYAQNLPYPKTELLPWSKLSESKKTEWVMLCNLINSFRGYAVEPIQITVRDYKNPTQPANYEIKPYSTRKTDHEAKFQAEQDRQDQATITRIEAFLFVVIGIMLTVAVYEIIL